MFYKKILIITLSLGLGLCQSFFKSSFPNEIGFRSARSFAIGQTHFINSNTSVNALRNPAKLHNSEYKIKIDFNIYFCDKFLSIKGGKYVRIISITKYNNT